MNRPRAVGTALNAGSEQPAHTVAAVSRPSPSGQLPGAYEMHRHLPPLRPPLRKRPGSTNFAAPQRVCADNTWPGRAVAEGFRAPR